MGTDLAERAPDVATGVAGPGLILAFLLNDLVALITAMAYAELGFSFYDAGDGYLSIKEGLPQPNGFISGRMSWFAHTITCSLYALGFGAYFGHVLDYRAGPIVPRLDGNIGYIDPGRLKRAEGARALGRIAGGGSSVRLQGHAPRRLLGACLGRYRSRRVAWLPLWPPLPEGVDRLRARCWQVWER